jgi:hypothetical protein
MSSAGDENLTDKLHQKMQTWRIRRLEKSENLVFVRGILLNGSYLSISTFRELSSLLTSKRPPDHIFCFLNARGAEIDP